MIRLAISPLLIAFGMVLILHFLAAAFAAWANCPNPAAEPTASQYWRYATGLLSSLPMAGLTLGAPFLPFILAAMFMREPERLYWQWVGIGITIGVLALFFSGSPSGRTCIDEGINDFGIPELVPMMIGLVIGFPVFLVVTYIGSIRLARRKDP